MANNYELNDEQLSSVSGGLTIELSEEDIQKYDQYVKPVLEKLQAQWAALSPEEKQKIKDAASATIQKNKSMLLLFGLSQEVIDKFCTELQTMINNL